MVHSSAVRSGAQALDDEWPKTDFTRTTIDLAEVRSGGPPRDGIPSIDQPVFISTTEADGWLHDNEPVIVVTRGTTARAYPIQILIYHEIVNDVIEGNPIAVTFCPLCNATLVFDRRLDGKVLEFGTTGRLRKSDMLMYDRQTESWWQQFTGTGVIGRYAGMKLVQIPASIVAYRDFKQAWPRGRVLSRQTGYSRPYGRNPYRGYDRVGDQPFLFDDPVDKRLPAMERVLYVRYDNKARLYPFSFLKKQPLLQDQVGQHPIVIIGKHGTLSPLDAETISRSRSILSANAWSRQVNGRILDFELDGDNVVDKLTRSQWNPLGRAVRGPLKGTQLEAMDSGVTFAFAWLAFYPDSEIYGPD